MTYGIRAYGHTAYGTLQNVELYCSTVLVLGKEWQKVLLTRNPAWTIYLLKSQRELSDDDVVMLQQTTQTRVRSSHESTVIRMCFFCVTILHQRKQAKSRNCKYYGKERKALQYVMPVTRNPRVRSAILHYLILYCRAVQYNMVLNSKIRYKTPLISNICLIQFNTKDTNLWFENMLECRII